MRSRFVVLVVACLMAVVASPASAADTTINFDSLASGTPVTDQFQNLGVRFARDESGATAVPTAGPRNGGSGMALDLYSSCGGEFCNAGSHTLSARLDFARQNVSVLVTNDKVDGRPNDFTDPPQLVAHRLGGAPDIVVTGTRGTTLPYQLSVTSPKQDIAFIEVNGVSQIDDLTYDNPSTPPPPDFSIVPQFDFLQTADHFEITAGHSSTLKVLLNRFNSSSGPIKFEASGLPSGVTISPALPTAFNGPDASTVSVTFNASASASAKDTPITLTATPASSGAGPTPHAIKLTLSVVHDYDLDVTGMEVTQGIQPYTVQCLYGGQCLNVASLPSPANDVTDYTGLPLVQGKTTVARVWVRSATKDLDVTGAQIELHAYNTAGKELAGSPLLAPYGNQAVTKYNPNSFVTLDQRVTPGTSWDFDLPDNWTRRAKLRLKAVISPPVAFNGPQECAGCDKNNSFDLMNIPFGDTGTIAVSPLGLYKDTRSATEILQNKPFSPLAQLPDIFTEYKFVRQIVPLADDALTWPGYYEGVISVGDLKASWSTDDEKTPAIRKQDSAMADRVDDWADDHESCAQRACTDMVQGFVSNLISPVYGLSRRKLTDGDEPVSVVSSANVEKSVSHELIHGLGQPHAGLQCGGNSNGQVGSAWPPDNAGKMQGIGYDVNRHLPFDDQAVSGVAANLDTGSLAGTNFYNGFFDTMSYCASEGNSWTSAIGWQQVYDDLMKIKADRSRAAKARRAHPRAVESLIHVSAVAQADGSVSIGTVKPEQAEPLSGSADYHLVAKDAGGAVKADVPMKATENHTHLETVATLLEASVPSAGVDSVEITHGGAVVASKKRSANAPVIKILSPKKGQRVGAGQLVKVRWTATDADNDPLLLQVAYAVDGKTFNSTFVGPNTKTQFLPSELFAGSRKARIRVTANDGFNSTSAISQPFTAVGRPPTVQVLDPGPGLAIANDASLQLRGMAFDDRGLRITGRKNLVWQDLGRVIGHGASVSVYGLKPGLRTLTLYARDHTGRRGKASVKVRVRGVKPRFLALGLADIAPQQRSFLLSVASSLPATLRIGRQHFHVDRKAKTVNVRIKPGATPLKLTLKLTAYGRSITQPLSVNRG